MTNETVETIRMYNQAYHAVHGRLPNVRTNNGWIRVNDSPKSFRPHQVRLMADRLRRRAREEDRPNRIVAEMAHERERIREHEEAKESHGEFISMLRESLREREQERNDVWDVREELNARVKNQIEQEAEAAFNAVKDNDIHVNIQGSWKEYVNKNTIIMFLNRLYEKAGHSAFDMQRMMDIFIHTGDFHDDEKPDCDECDVTMELEYLRDKLDSTQDSISKYRARIRSRNNDIDSLKRNILNLQREMAELKKNSIVFSMDEI